MDIKAIMEKFQLSSNEYSILNYLEENRLKGLKSPTIRQLSQKTYSSPGFIVSMCKKIGFSGYSELIYYMYGAKNLTFKLHDYDVIKTYGSDFKYLLDSNKKNFFNFIGLGMSNNISNYMADYFNIHGFRATSNAFLESFRIDENDTNVIVLVSNSGETKYLIDLIKRAQQHNIEIIAFVGSSDSTISKMVPFTISTDTFSSYSFQNCYPQLFYGNILNLFEILMSVYFTKIKI
ncbi:MurR/RpiR family transcriptional regulator [Streptococcus castoreus]|uniref:MurR/RpiR family transcriptional regulator n=1 Tax=Streptococcus castoreus TaxID=254786 RepID=UPI0004262A80|nr:SIS domain-containing protein [Streptococcus castoreus]